MRITLFFWLVIFCRAHLLLFRTECGIARLAFAHGCFSSTILDYLTRRHNSSVKKNEVSPKCDVTTTLLIFLKVTGHGKQDLVEQVFAIDTYEWCSSDADARRLAIMRTLGNVSGKEGVDRKRMLKSGADSVDIKMCLTRRLHEPYVLMPTKKQKRKRKRASKAASSTEVPADVTADDNLDSAPEHDPAVTALVRQGANHNL